MVALRLGWLRVNFADLAADVEHARHVSVVGAGLVDEAGSVGGVGTPEVQRVVLGSSTAADTVSGTFELKLGDLESGAINYGASAADVKTKLDAAFATTARPDVQVEVLASTTGTSQAAYVIAFTRGRPGALPLMALKTTLAGLTAHAPDYALLCVGADVY